MFKILAAVTEHSTITDRPVSSYLRLIGKRKRAYSKVKTTNNDSDWLKFRILRNMVTKLFKESKFAHHNRQVENLRNNSKHQKQ